MNTRSQQFHLATIALPRAAQASRKELRDRARRLRIAIEREGDLHKLVQVFSETLMDQDAFIEGSRSTDDARFTAMVGPHGPLGIKFPGETFHAGLLYCRDLELFHGSVISTRRTGIAFQFAGAKQGVIAVYTHGENPMADVFRYSVLLERSGDAGAPVIMTRGGAA
jgi:hypothetical protein